MNTLLSLKMLNPDAVLNNFEETLNAQIMRGADNHVVMRLVQPQHKDLRYIPLAGATFSLTLKNSDGTTISKTPTNPFADDRSILAFDLSAAETTLLISQSLSLTIVEGSVTSLAVLQQALQVISSPVDC